MTDNKILVEKISEKLSNEIIIPMTGRKVGLLEGKVIEVGPGRILNTGVNSPCLVNKGDRIIFNTAGTSTITMYVDGLKKIYYVMADVEAIMILESDKERLG